MVSLFLGYFNILDKAVKSLFSCTEMWTSIIKDAKNAQLSPSLRASAVCVIANFARSGKIPKY